MLTPAATNSVRTLNTPRTFPPVSSRTEWQARAADIRRQVLVSSGLWPLPEKTPLQARVFDRRERDGYSVEKVAFQSWPGLYVGGNLYRPRGQGPGPFPGVLNPHGHWANGRLADTQDGSVAARCIGFARQGMVAFSYDMVGYNDTFFANHPREGTPGFEFYKRHRLFATNRVCQLWGINLLGLQTWNSIRALDFLASLPDVDPKRLACTGASGGGTQTFLLGAVDDRLAAQAPVVMVSHTMQGGCSCENAPGLRVEYSNMEIAAAAAPRPQILVAATGDWTRATLTVEGPAIEAVYRLFDAADRLRYVRFDFGHNYNQTSREAVYAWFARWLRQQPDAAARPEAPYQKEPDADLRVWPEGKLPEDAVTDEQLIAWLMAQRRAQLAALQPRHRKSLQAFQDALLPLWRHTLQVEWPPHQTRLTFKPVRSGAGFTATELEFRHEGEAAAAAAVCFRPAAPRARPTAPAKLVVLAPDDSAQRFCDPDGNPQGLAGQLVRRGHAVLVLTRYARTPTADPFAAFFTTYNRTLLQERVRDITAACALASALLPSKTATPRVVLCGLGRAGLWSVLAAPAAAAVVADCDGVNAEEDAPLLAPDLFCPGLRCLGGFDGAAALAAPRPLLLHNLGTRFPTALTRAAYRAAQAGGRLRLETAPLSEADLLRRIERL